MRLGMMVEARHIRGVRLAGQLYLIPFNDFCLPQILLMTRGRHALDMHTTEIP
jgi:hypothetical protein